MIKKVETYLEKKLAKKSGIYKLKSKHDDRLFYIGKSVNLSVRLRDHFNRSALYNNRLGLFITMIGWSNRSVHILEFCPETELDNRENYYIKNYLPTLNRKFSSAYSLKIYKSLTSILDQRRVLNKMNYRQLNQNFTSNSPLWVYTYPDLKLVNGLHFENIFKLINYFKFSRKTIYKYLDTFTPYNGYIFLKIFLKLLLIKILKKLETQYKLLKN